MRVLLPAALALAAAGLAACGGSGGGSVDPASVTSCLEDAGFGVTAVPASDIAEGGSENRGPGQTGELLTAKGKPPEVGADEAAATISFWESTDAASNQVTEVKKDNLGLIAGYGEVTVQSASALRTEADWKQITSCAQ
jgi:hypothetical protein